jgi:uncharacterized protein
MSAPPTQARRRASARQRALRLVLALGVVAGLAGLRGVRFDNSLFVMLPDAAPVRQALDFLQEANYSDKVVLSFANEDETVDRATFLERVSAFVASLRSPWLHPVALNLGGGETLEHFAFFLRCAPLILHEHDRAEIERRLQPSALDRILRRRYRQLLQPEGSFLAPAIRRDPLDAQGLILERLQSLRATFGYGATLENDGFVSADGRHAMRLFETSADMADVEASAALMNDLDEARRRLPPGLRADVVCGHAHTVGNRQAIESDIRRMALLATGAFLLLFWICFRTAASLWIFLIPLVSALWALNVAGRLTHGFSVLVAGLGSVVAGIAVDYGIHVFVALRRHDSAGRAVRDLARPLGMSALTTLAVFVALLFSSVAGYRQLGLFAGLSIVISLGLALGVLPRLLAYGPHRSAADGSGAVQSAVAPSAAPRAYSVRRRRWTFALYGLVMAALLAQARKVRFDTDLQALDGAGAAVQQAEQRFRETWLEGATAQAFLVVAAADYEAAEQLNQRVADDLLRTGVTHALNFAHLWPTPERRRRHAAAWRDFWNEPRVTELRDRLALVGRRHGFSEGAFDPFFAWIEEPPVLAQTPADNPVFDRIRERFAHRGRSGWTFATWFPDTVEHNAAMRRIAERHEGAFVVSRRGLGDELSNSVSAEMLRLSALAVVLMLVVVLLAFRDPRLALAALVPAASGLIVILAGLAVLDTALSIANVMALIVVAGLCIDYGIFIVHLRLRGRDHGIRVAVTLSAVTTLIGSAALLFARHPVLFSIGLTLTLGVAGGYAVAMLFLPAWLDGMSVYHSKTVD